MNSSSQFSLFTSGVDVSGAGQPFAIDWAQVRAANKRFAYVKANTAEGAPDPWFRRHAAGAMSAGLLVGAYHFALIDDDPKDDVAAFLRAIEGVPLDLPPALDIETRNSADALRVLMFVDGGLAELEARTGKRAIIYTGPGFWRGLGKAADDPRYAARALWVAQYGVSGPSPLPPWGHQWSIWQSHGNTIWRMPDGSQVWGPTRPHPQAALLAAGGKCPGIAGEVDLDLFAGSYDDMRRWAGLNVAQLPNLADDPRVKT